MHGTLIRWRDDFSVGVAALDEQHKQIVDVVNVLYAIKTGNTGRKELYDVLMRLRIFTETHFRYEEVLFKYTNFHDRDAHRALHTAMIAETARTLGIVENAVDTDVSPLLVQLSHWWVDHITGADRKNIGDVTKLGLP